jgi:UDP-glucose 4-epimerase
MKILVTGVAGFLGSHIADKMLKLGHYVIGNDNLIGGNLDNVNQNVEFYEIDCCDYDKILQITKGVDIVVHAAATAHEGFSVFSPNFITKNIYQASMSVISAAINRNVKRIVFCSSMARYGNSKTPFVEDLIPAPVDPYGIAKVAVEDTLKVLAEVHNFEYNIAIPHNIIGPRQRYDDPYRNVISIMINRVLQGKPPIVYGSGQQKRCFSYVFDCVNCLEKLILDKEIKNETVNIGPDEHEVTINTIAEKILKFLNSDLDIVYVPERPQEVKIALCSSNKARKILGYRTETDLDMSIQETINYIKHKGVKSFDYSYEIEIINDKTPITWKNRLF